MKIIGIIGSIIIIVIATVVFLLTPTIKLNGNPSMEVSMAEGYKEPGCAAKYAFLDISSHIKTESAVNDKKVGEYKVTYSVSFLKKSAKAVRKVTVVDKEPPEIVLRGGDEIKVEQYSSFKDPGYTVVDDSDGDITQKATAKGIVDTYNPGKYTISYHAVDSYGNKATHERTVNVESGSDSDEEKVIYLTFDDGPSSAVTPEVLDVLKKYDVPATFFILDYGDSEENISLLKKAISQGHTIGIHGYSHDYGEIYKSVPGFMENVTKLDQKIKKDLDYEPFVIRFPGGSSNTVSTSVKKGIMTELVNIVQEEGYYYSDWNVDSTDASGNNIDKDAIVNAVKKNCSERGYNIVLMHDSNMKKTTAKALPEIIEWAKEEGYIFKAMKKGGPTIHHSVNN